MRWSHARYDNTQCLRLVSDLTTLILRQSIDNDADQMRGHDSTPKESGNRHRQCNPRTDGQDGANDDDSRNSAFRNGPRLIEDDLPLFFSGERSTSNCRGGVSGYENCCVDGIGNQSSTGHFNTTVKSGKGHYRLRQEKNLHQRQRSQALEHGA